MPPRSRPTRILSSKLLPYLGLSTRCCVFIICTIAALPIPVSAASAATQEGGMTEAERAYLLGELKSSQAALLLSIKGLTPAQWKFKPAPEVLNSIEQKLDP